MAKQSAIRQAEDLYKKLRASSLPVAAIESRLTQKLKTFIQATPTPAGFALNRLNQAIPGGIAGGLQRIRSQPLSYYTPLSMKSLSVPLARTAFAPLGSQRAADIGYGLRGFLNVTPFQYFRKPDLYEPQTVRQKTAQQIGQDIGIGTIGAIATAPLGGAGRGLARTAISRLGMGGVLGAGMGLAKNVLYGRPLTTELAESTARGIKYAPMFAITGTLIDKVATRFVPHLTSQMLGEPFKQLGIASLTGAALKERLPLLTAGIVNNFARGLLEVLPENTAFTLMDKLTGIEKRTVLKAWIENLPGSLLSNMVWYGASSAAGGTYNLTAGERVDAKNAVMTALKMVKGKLKDEAGFLNLFPAKVYKPNEAEVKYRDQLIKLMSPEEKSQLHAARQTKAQYLQSQIDLAKAKEWTPISAIRPLQHVVPGSNVDLRLKGVPLMADLENMVNHYAQTGKLNKAMLRDVGNAIINTAPDSPYAPYKDIVNKVMEFHKITPFEPEAGWIAIGYGKKKGIEPSIEEIIEKSEGFKPGMKTKFDQAMYKKDIKTIKKLLPQVPQAYKNRFAAEINNLLQIKKTGMAVPGGKGKIPPQPIPSISEPAISALSPTTPGAPGIPYDKSISQVVNPTDPYFNVKRLKVDKPTQWAVKQAVENSKPEIEKITGTRLKNKEILTIANNTARVLRQAIGEEQTRAWEAAMLRTRQQLAMQAQTGTASREFIENLLVVKSQGEDIARKLQSLSIEAQPQTTTAKQVIFEAILKVNKNIDQLVKAAEGVDFNDPQQAAEFMRKFIKPTLDNWLDTIRYNSMLTSPNTHLINISSNYQGTGFVAPIEKTITGGLDFVKHLLTGKPRQYFAGEGLEYAKGYYSQTGTAFRRLIDVMQGKYYAAYPDTRDIPLATKGIAGISEKILKFPMRALEGMDQFFTVLTRAGAEKALTYRLARGGVETIAPAQEAAKRLFRAKLGDTTEGHILRLVDYLPQKMLEARHSTNPIVSNISKLSLPFVRVPTNLFKQGIEYSPLGITTLYGAKEQLPQISKAIMGSLVGLGAAALAASNRITFDAPSSSRVRNAMDDAGVQPYSVKIGNIWVSYEKLHPVLSFNLALVAAVNEASLNGKITDDQLDKILRVAANVLNFYADQSYVRQIGDILDAAKGQALGIPKLVSNIWQQFVPFRAFAGWLARLTDPNERQIQQDAGVLQKQLQQFYLQIPGLRQTLEPRYGEQGEPIKNQLRLLKAISPSRLRVEKPEKRPLYDVLSLTYQKLKAMPKDQAAMYYVALKKINPSRAASIREQFVFESLRLGTKEAEIKDLPVYNGARARAILRELNKKSANERVVYYQKLKQAGIISNQISQQLFELYEK